MPRSTPIIVPSPKRRLLPLALVDAFFDKLAAHMVPVLARQYEAPPASTTGERETDEDCTCPECLQAHREELSETGARPQARGMTLLSAENPLRIWQKVCTNPINLADLIANFHTVLPHAEADARGLSPSWALVLRLFNGGGLAGTTMPLSSALMMLDHFTYNGEYSLLVIAGHPALDAEVLAMVFAGWLASVQRTYALFDAARVAPPEGDGTAHLRVLPPRTQQERDGDADDETDGPHEHAPIPLR